MNREKELVKNTAILSLGKLLPKLSSLVTLPILTAYLTKAEYGTYDLITTLVMLVIPIGTLQIQSAAFRFLIEARENKIEAASIISNIFVVTIPISFVASIIIQFFFPEMGYVVRLLIATYFFMDTIQLTLGQIARGLGNNKLYSIVSIVVSGVNMIGTVLGVYILKEGLAGILAAMTMALIVGATYYIFTLKLWTYCSFRLFSTQTIKELLAYSWPMVPNNLSTWVLKLSDRLVITYFLGVEANAVYAVANKIPSLLAMGQSIMVMAWHENASIAVGDKNVEEYYSKMLDKVFSLMFGCTALLIAATPIIFSFFVKGDYQEAYDQMPVLILAMFFFVMSSFFGGIYIAHKRTVNVGLSTMVAAVINLVIDLGFVNVIGVWAGSISTLVAYMILYYYRMFNSKKFQSIDVKYWKQGVQVGILVAMLIMCFQQNILLDMINILISILVAVLFNKEYVGMVAQRALKVLKK